MTFSADVRQRCIDLHGIDPESSYRELLLDVRVGGPAMQRICAGLMAERTEELSPTELLVLRHVANGKEDREIAAQRGRSEESIKDHMKHIRRKLGASTRAQAVHIAHQRGIL